jgi:L-seryl-tRNA(Ser) seleniumtransferase
MTDARRNLPSIERLLADPRVAPLLDRAPRDEVVQAAREAVAAARTSRDQHERDWATDVADRLAARERSGLRPVINATGVVLHTNLGRAPLAEVALRAMQDIGRGYSTLEYDLDAGTRGHRSDHVRDLISRLTGAEDALVVNNAAGALVLALAALGGSGGVAISRGELIEIGGSFRIPDILRASGARLIEIGTTNRTHLADYEGALDAGARCILVVHRSNFIQSGYVHAPAPAEVAKLARERGLPCIHDLGSGLLLPLPESPLASEPTLGEAVAAGADVVIASGDKLLGGPQAGIMVGRRAAVSACRSHPMARAVRSDKFTLAALDATLRLYQEPERARRDIPVLAMLTATPAAVADRATRLLVQLPAEFEPRLEDGISAVGGGAAPAVNLPTTLVTLAPGELGVQGLLLRLRLGDPAIVARAEGNRVALDPRTMTDEELAPAARAVAGVGVDPGAGADELS